MLLDFTICLCQKPNFPLQNLWLHLTVAFKTQFPNSQFFFLRMQLLFACVTAPLTGLSFYCWYTLLQNWWFCCVLHMFCLKTGDISSHNLIILCTLCFDNSVPSNLHGMVYWSDIWVNTYFDLTHLVLFIPSTPHNIFIHKKSPHYHNWI